MFRKKLLAVTSVIRENVDILTRKNTQQLNNIVTNRYICETQCLHRGEDRKEMLRAMPKKDQGTAGERGADLDTLAENAGFKRFPDLTTHKKLFNGVPFDELPICNIKASPNNTIIQLTNHKGDTQVYRSCGMEGFKNTRKGTNIAAQATAISLGSQGLDLGLKSVRVRVRGIGPGRMSAIKGLQMAGMEVVSITDNTPVSWQPPRPRKAKKL